MPNPLGAEPLSDTISDTLSDASALGGGGGGGLSSNRAGGVERSGRQYASPDEFWARVRSGSDGGGGSAASFASSRTGVYWGSLGRDYSAMLGGLERVHPADVSTSLAFIDKLIRPSHGGEGGGSEEGGSEGGESSRVAGSSGAEPALPHGAGAIALDCGAGIGRVSSTVLLERFEQAKSHTPFFVFLPFDRGAGIGEVSSHLLLERF